MAVRIESQAEPIPGYKLVERLGGGGFGEVWKAIAPGGLHKAIKFVYGDLEAVGGPDGTRADQELKAMARVKTIRHPFVLSLERFDIIDGQLIIVMELADRSLWDRFRECRNHGMSGIPREELIGYLMETAEALDLMNLQHDLQHLDIKPQNLFLVHNHVKVADFGLVKDLEGRAASVTGGVTPVYAAPETFDGWVSRFSDQYSLAIVYQELLTGIRPFAGNNTRQLIMQHLQGQPNLEPLPPGDRPLVARALSKNPSDRHPNCLDFIRALKTAERSVRPLSLPDLPTVPEEPVVTPISQKFDSNVRPLAAEGHGTEEASPSQILYARATITEAVAPPRRESLGPTLPAEATRPRRLVAEERGDGELVPALVIGLGRMGRGVVAQVKAMIENRFGTGVALPHLQYLAIDTDPESFQDGREPEEVLLTRLSRPSRYLRPRDLLPPIEEWLPAKMIYRIPRSLVTTGIRALGRLAFLDHYRTIAGRLQRELEKITGDGVLAAAARATGLKLRSNCPQVYIAAHLAGGTGSGMFLDVAFLVRSLLVELGFIRPEIIGLFYLPAVEERSETALPLANTYAALTELHHYMSGNRFQGQYESRSAPLIDAGPPFSRCVLVPLGRDAVAASLTELTAPVGDYIYRELLTPLGSAVETERDKWAQGRADAASSAFQSFGLHVISFPRRRLIQQAARQVCRLILELWVHKSPPEMGPLLHDDMCSRLAELQLAPEALRQALEAGCGKVFQKSIAEIHDEWLTAPRQAAEAGVPDLPAVVNAVRTCDEWYGSLDETLSLRPAPIPTQFQELAERHARPAIQDLVGIVMRFLDQPGYRLGAAETAIRQTVAIVEEWLQQAEAEVQFTERELPALRQRIYNEIAECERLGSGRKAEARRVLLAGSLQENVAAYVAAQHRRTLAHRCAQVYLSLRGRMSDQIKEINFCRGRFRDLIADFCPAEEAESTAADKYTPHVRILNRSGETLADAVAATLMSITGDQLGRFELELQSAIQNAFPPLYQLCVGSTDRFRALGPFLQCTAEALLDGHLPHSDVAQLLVEQFPDEHLLLAEAQAALDEAMPASSGQNIGHQGEIGILVMPATEWGQHLADAVRQTAPEIRVVASAATEELVFYRECQRLVLPDLKQLGPLARDAYRASCSLEHFSPHARLDVVEWTEIVPDVSSKRRSPDTGFGRR